MNLLPVPPPDPVQNPVYLSDDERAIIAQARELLSDDEKWTQGAQARDALQQVVKPTDPDACSWCLIGALARFSPSGLVPYNVLRLIDQRLPFFTPNFARARAHGIEWMQDRFFDHQKVLEFLDFVLTPWG